jgi:hypothetical protein
MDDTSERDGLFPLIEPKSAAARACTGIFSDLAVLRRYWRKPIK